MTYSPWQIARLRKRLTSYKLHRKRTWEQIATDMLFCESMPEAYVDQEDVRPLSESLRRFTSMIQEPHEARLTAVRIYLQAEGYLTADDMVEKAFPYHLAMSCMEAFGHAGMDQTGGQDVVNGSWVHLTEDPTSLSEIALEVSTADDNLMQVEETQTLYKGTDPYNLHTMAPRRKLRHVALVQRCKGFAVRATQNRLLMFLFGDDYSDTSRLLVIMIFEMSSMEDAGISDRIHCWEYSKAEVLPGSVSAEPNFEDDEDSDVAVQMMLNPRSYVQSGAILDKILSDGIRVFKRMQ